VDSTCNLTALLAISNTLLSYDELMLYTYHLYKSYDE
jgi:hypothetical protein